MSSFMTSRRKSTTSKNIEAKLSEKENEIQLLQKTPKKSDIFFIISLFALP